MHLCRRLIALNTGLLLLLPMLLAGCGSLQSPREDDAATGWGSPALESSPDIPGARQADGLSAADPGLSIRRGPGSYVYSRDPRELTREVAQACQGARGLGESDVLRSLTADLYFSEIHPAAATEALLRGGCGGLGAVVEEMVAQGGDAVVESVVGRARSIGGDRAGRQIDAAAAVGLARYAKAVDAERGSGVGDLPSFGMMYFPSQGEGSKLATSVALNRLYDDAVPGYGIYTFVLLGPGMSRPAEDDAARYSELFRMIETYVSPDDGGNARPGEEAHVFLVPVNPERIGGPLVDQVSQDLSDLMRRHLIQTLRHLGQPALAERLERGAGPFLVATLGPRLTPPSASAPWMLTDLSHVGPEHVYSVVDAFDRAIPDALSGQPESLRIIRERLIGLPIGTGQVQGVNAGNGIWLVMLDDRAQAARLNDLWSRFG
ncbi:hypothetical protein [Thiorhodococcus minor]|uniref:Uncharacterized protein n=1 Tax=Thiorhodococcus minor TaxID=57489 RepID=A0A6M0JY12_9GAMM|nr:hypothetical protein [Thiorhodococcus minor]NEV61891.1 hypothetical protein [Thiorhodococcus minor]